MLSASEHLSRAEAADQRAALAADSYLSRSFRALAEHWRELAQHAPATPTTEYTLRPVSAERTGLVSASRDADAAVQAAPGPHASRGDRQPPLLDAADLAPMMGRFEEQRTVRAAVTQGLERVDERLGGSPLRRLALLAALLLFPVAIALIVTG